MPVSSQRESSDAQLLLGEPPGASGIGTVQAAQAALASGAFPFAFRPRQLCDCSLRCPEEEVVRDGACEGPEPGQKITSLSCQALQPAGSRQLCRHAYIDGGIFDNSGAATAVDEQARADRQSLPEVHGQRPARHRDLAVPAQRLRAREE